MQLKMYWLPSFYILFSVLPCIAFGLSPDASPQEVLVDKFFGGNRLMSDVLPKKNFSDSKPLKVHFTFVISNIFDIKSDKEELDLGIWIAMHWTNELVSWNKSQYPVEYLEVPINKVWIPTLFLQQNVIAEILKPHGNNGIVIVYPTGLTTLDFGTRIKLTCLMPACLFPMDTHRCPLKFVSIAQSAKMLVFVPDDKTRMSYDSFAMKSTGLWEIETHTFTDASRTMITNGGFKRHSSVLETALTFKHKPKYYWLTILFPITLICTVTFFAVLLPRENGERTSLLITCFLAQIVYLDNVLKSVPKTSDYVPLLVIFLFVVLLFTACQIGLTAIAAYYAERASKRKDLSSCHKKFAMMLSKIFMVSKGRKNQVQSIENISHYGNDIKLKKRHSLVDSSHSPNTIIIPNKSEDNQMEADAEKEAEEEPQEKADGDRPMCCNTMCKVIDRLSVILSFMMLFSIPIAIQLVYDRTIKFDCGIPNEN